jgi:hypothetical protein
MGPMVGIGRSARLTIARDKLDIDRFGSDSVLWGCTPPRPVFIRKPTLGPIRSIGCIGPVAAIEDEGTILYSIVTCFSSRCPKVYPG